MQLRPSFVSITTCVGYLQLGISTNQTLLGPMRFSLIKKYYGLPVVSFSLAYFTVLDYAHYVSLLRVSIKGFGAVLITVGARNHQHSSALRVLISCSCGQPFTSLICVLSNFRGHS